MLSLKDRLKDFNDMHQNHKPITLRNLKAIYKKYQIKKKNIKKAYNWRKYDHENKYKNMLIEVQDKLIKADQDG